MLLWTIETFTPDVFDAANQEMRINGEITEEAAKALKKMDDRGVQIWGKEDVREERRAVVGRFCVLDQSEVADQSG